MATKAGPRIRNIIKRIPTGAVTNPNTNEQIKLSIATEVRKETSHWVWPEEIAQGQANALWKAMDHNKDQLKPGTVEISQREAQYNSENDPRHYLTCCNKYDDRTTNTEHYPKPKGIEGVDDIKTNKNTEKSSEKKSEESDRRKWNF